MDNGNFVMKDLGYAKMLLDRSEYIDGVILRTGCFERQTTDWIKMSVRPGDVVVDVGANIGYYTLLSANLVGESGRVVAIEPTAHAMYRLQKNIVLNSFSNVEYHKVALSEASRPAVNITYDPRLYYTSADTSIRSSWRMENGGVGSAHSHLLDFCDFLPFDQFCTRAGIEHVDVMKIDVDGHELEVLAGSSETLARFRPTLIIELLDPSRAPERFSNSNMARKFSNQMEQIFLYGYQAISETGETFSDSASIISFLAQYDGRSGAPNFLFRA